ncbi:MAG: hypothetical protein JW836_11810 [Deltaproteobacteria bacterium]|nr:hypothetical protein [Deltaproteobacteria bacterium]
MKNLLLVLIISFSVGCTANRSSCLQDFSAQPPEKWHRVDSPEFYILTKDGPYSQYILIQQRPLEKPFIHTSKALAGGMSSGDAAALFLEEIMNDEAVYNFRLLENRSAHVNHHEAFRLVFTYENKEGLKFQTYMYGFINGNWFYTLRYNADLVCYSHHDIEEFHRFLRSFRITDA